MGGYITKLEAFTDLEGSIIRTTKIHKVIKLSSIPRDENEPETPTAASSTDKDGLATNGLGKDGNGGEKDEEKSASGGERKPILKQVEPVGDADEDGLDAGNTNANPRMTRTRGV
ncbi:MAG: hypothetical protein M1840_007875 [Geoglossum simile]|nr:MAG: hypothetical protein M1840_007875 [Geoglossum simile]